MDDWASRRPETSNQTSVESKRMNFCFTEAEERRSRTGARLTTEEMEGKTVRERIPEARVITGEGGQEQEGARQWGTMARHGCAGVGWSEYHPSYLLLLPFTHPARAARAAVVELRPLLRKSPRRIADADARDWGQIWLLFSLRCGDPVKRRSRPIACIISSRSHDNTSDLIQRSKPSPALIVWHVGEI